MGISDILTLLSGIALFLFGMNFMGDGLKKVAGNKLEMILYKLSSTPLKSVLLGTGVTSVIQSSSATSIMTVGFVNSGMMKLRQAIGVILGAVLGTSITGWIICLSMINGGAGWTQIISTDTLTCAIAIIGVIMILFSKKTIYNNIGMILMGFAVLMIGIDLMSGAVAPLKESAAFTGVLVSFSNAFLGMLAGLIITCVLQSASAAVGILQALSITGAINFSIAFPLILGIGIGSSTPVVLSSIGAKINGKRAAYTYFFVNLLGAIVFGVSVYTIDYFIDLTIMDKQLTSISIAALNSIYRFLIVITLSPFISFIEKFLNFVFKDKENEIEDTSTINNLQDRLIEYPSVAIEQTKIAVNDMAEKSVKNLNRSLSLLFNYSPSAFNLIQEKENVIDKYEDKLGSFIVKMTKKELNNTQNKDISRILHALGDFERIGDHAVNISETAKEIYEKKMQFSEEAIKEIGILIEAVKEITEVTVSAFKNQDFNSSIAIESLEDCIDNLCDEIKHKHILRVKRGQCSLLYGYVFNDILTNMERISDHCSNIGVALIQNEDEDINQHEYIENLKNKDTSGFENLLIKYTNKYSLK